MRLAVDSDNSKFVTKDELTKLLYPNKEIKVVKARKGPSIVDKRVAAKREEMKKKANQDLEDFEALGDCSAEELLQWLRKELKAKNAKAAKLMPEARVQRTRAWF